MLGYIIGEVAEINQSTVILDNNGIGYELNVSVSALSRCEIGKKIKLYTYIQINESEVFMYGFYSKEEKEMFLKLITISGIGPKLAISILSGIEVDKLVYVIASEDSKQLSSIKGVGKKTAERIILELKGKIEVGDFTSADNNSTAINDAILALTTLGFSRADAVKTVTKASEKYKSTEDIIQYSLKIINRIWLWNFTTRID